MYKKKIYVTGIRNTEIMEKDYVKRIKNMEVIY